VLYTPISTPTSTPLTLKDPIIGTWMCYSNSASGRTKKEFTFMENHTLIRTITNLKSRVKGYSYGIWKKESTENYLTESSNSAGLIPWQYNSVKDELYLPLFQETYHRISDTDNPNMQVPSMNITLHTAQKVSEIQGSHPFSGKKFLVINVSIENGNETSGFSLDDQSIWVMDNDGHEINSMNKQEVGRLLNPIPFGMIAVGETRQGNVVFAVSENSHSYTLKLFDSEGVTVSNIISLENIQTAPTNSSDTG
jgi:hypothetical protein